MSYPDGSSCTFIENYRGYNILSCGPGTFPYDAQGVITYTIPDLYGIYYFYESLARAHEVIDEALGIEIATVITIDAPPSVMLGYPFTISGYLKELATGIPISGMQIGILLDGSPWLQVVTDINGFYEVTTSLDVLGTYLLEVVFAL